MVVVCCHQLRLGDMIGIKHNDCAVLGGTSRHDDGDTMVLGMDAAFNVDKYGPETGRLHDVWRSASEVD